METIVLDDNIEYAIICEKEIDGTYYTLFANVNDGKDICFRKTITDEDDGEEYYVGLDNKEELEKVIKAFAKHYKIDEL